MVLHQRQILFARCAAAGVAAPHVIEVNMQMLHVVTRLPMGGHGRRDPVDPAIGKSEPFHMLGSCYASPPRVSRNRQPAARPQAE
jgi:hypothetical protein